MHIHLSSDAFDLLVGNLVGVVADFLQLLVLPSLASLISLHHIGANPSVVLQ